MASTASDPTTPTGLLIAKKMPGSNTVAAIKAIIATKDSKSIAPYPIIGIYFSLSNSLGVVPEAIKEWNPEIDPHAMVIKTKGNRLPPKIGPVPSVNWVRAGIFISGCRVIIATAKTITVPNFTNVDR